jgi:hypothetical protein
MEQMCYNQVCSQSDEKGIAMIHHQMQQLWQKHADNTTRESIVDTLVLALGMRTVFTEDQLLAAIAFLMDICQVEDDSLVLDMLRGSVERVNGIRREDAITHIGQRLGHLQLKTRETVMLMAIIYFHFSAPDDERPLMKDSVLPHISTALGVTDAIPALLTGLRRELNQPQSAAKRPKRIIY